MVSKTQQVKTVFEEPQWYLERRRYNITIRAETVQELLAGKTFDRIIDIACGDASISLPLLTQENRLTLVDISSAMLAHARSRIPSALTANVDILNQDFMSANLRPQSYDLVMCLGLLAHVDNPAGIIAKITSLVKPGGTIIMESTDAANIMNDVTVYYHKVTHFWKRETYDLNLITTEEVVRMFAQHRVKLAKIFRYSLPLFPGINRIAPQRLLYNMVRLAFGNTKRNRNAWLGKECIYIFEPEKKA